MTVGPVKSAPIPFSDIEVYVNRARLETRCLSFDQLIDELFQRGYLPPILCSKTPAGQKEVTASGPCKCVGDAACGGGRMYEVCYKTQADCKNAQKDLDNFCNNNEEMKERCTRPRCYYRHSQPKCPDECDTNAQTRGPAHSRRSSSTRRTSPRSRRTYTTRRPNSASLGR